MKRFLWAALICCIASPLFAVDLSITAANVAASSGAQYADGTAGATITAGQAVYLDASANTYKLADCDATAATAVIAGIALNGASSGQPLKIQTAGTISIGGTVTVGEIYVLSGTAGGIAPEGDLAQNDRVVIIGVGLTSSTIALRLYNSAVLVP